MTTRYSTNEGLTWSRYNFTKNPIRVYGLLTEPGEKTTIFTIFGSFRGFHRWVVFQVNMSNVLGEFVMFICGSFYALLGVCYPGGVHKLGASVAQSSKQRPSTTEVVGTSSVFVNTAESRGFSPLIYIYNWIAHSLCTAVKILKPDPPSYCSLSSILFAGLGVAVKQ